MVLKQKIWVGSDEYYPYYYFETKQELFTTEVNITRKQLKKLIDLKKKAEEYQKMLCKLDKNGTGKKEVKCPQCHKIEYNPRCQYCNENRYLPKEMSKEISNFFNDGK